MHKLLIPTLLLTTNLLAQTFNVATTPQLRTALENSAINGEADTIILADGTYKTTDDSLGTFTFFDNESYSLTLKGSSKDKVILSGDHVSQIFNFETTTNKAGLIVENITFSDANNTNSPGGAIFTDYTLTVVSCDFINNSATGYGGGFYASGSATITNTSFKNNSATGDGGGFYTDNSATITDTTFTGNNASSEGDGHSGEGVGLELLLQS